jgi:ketosteroid isomerase-like protein
MAKKVARKAARKAPRKVAARPAPKSPGAADTIHRLDAAFMKAANARNGGALVKAFYASDAVLMPPNHAAVEGHTAIQAFLQGLMDAGLTSIKLETTTVASAGDLAYGRGRYTLSMSPVGGAPVQDVGKYVVVYRRQPSGGWRAVADIFNSDQAH